MMGKVYQNRHRRSQNSKIDSIWSKIYPVGSIYMSTSSTNPSTLFGGSWSQITGRFLLAAGNGYSAGSTGGEATHVLTQNEMPNHTHSWWMYNFTQVGGTGGGAGVLAGGTTSQTTGSSGGGVAHNNMPPYYVVYMWHRTA